MSKLLVLNGSPRKNGNTSCLTGKLLEGAKSKGADVEEIFLGSLNIHPCTACESCSSISSYCVFEDDMQEVCRKIVEADSVVFASPVYWFNVSAQLKLAIDRIFGIFKKDNTFFQGKKLGVVLCYGDKEPMESGVINAYGSLRDMASYTGAVIVGIVHGCAYEAGEIMQNKALLKQAYELGIKLV